MQNGILKILILEDSETDAEIIQRLLKKSNARYQFKVVMDRENYSKALDEFKPCLILSDNSMPQFNATEALEIVKQHKLNIPFILVTGTVSEEFAVKIIKAGADDYILKDRLTRLPGAIETALKQKKSEADKQETAERLKQSEEKYRGIMDRISDAFVGLDNKWNYTYVNRKAGEILKRRPEELIGKNIWTESPILEGLPLKKAFMEASKEQHYIYLEEYFSPLGICLENHIYPTPDGISVFFRDVTEKKKAEEILIEERDKFAKIAATSPGLIYSFRQRTNGTFSLPYTSDAIENIFGFASGDVVEDATRFFNLCYSEDIADIKKSIAASAENLAPWKAEFRYLHPAKGLIWLAGDSLPMLEPDGSILWQGVIMDITVNKTATEEIKKSNDRFKMIALATNDVIWEWDLQTGELWWNENYYSLFGFDEMMKPKDMTSWSKCIHPEDRKRVWDGMHQAIDSGETFWDDEFRSCKNNGTALYIYNRCFILRDALNKAYRMVGSMLNFTERKNAEDAVKKSERRYYTLAEVSPVGIFYTDSNGLTTYVNRRWSQITGFPFKDALGNGWINIIYDEDKPALAKAWSKAMKTEAFSAMEYRLVRPNGNIVWVLGQATPEKNEANEVVGYVGTITDITELKRVEEAIKKSEEQYRVLVQEASEGIFISDAIGHFLTVNASACKISQYTEQELLCMTVYDFFSVADLAMNPLQYESLRKGNTVILEREMKRKDGAFIHLEITSKLLTDGRVLSLARDIEERIKTQQEIKQTNEKLRELTTHLQHVREEERVRIGREIHDELGQQLTAIKMDAVWIDQKITASGEFIPADKTDTLIKTKLKNIIQLLDGSNQSIRRILSELRPAILHDYGLHDSLEWLNEQLTANTGILINFESNAIEFKMPEKVAICVFRVYQEAFTNITKYSHAGKVATSLYIADNTLKVTIEDDGQGFDVANLKTTKSFGILGMKERIHSVGGNFELISSKGKGTKIAVSIPLDIYKI